MATINSSIGTPAEARELLEITNDFNEKTLTYNAVMNDRGTFIRYTGAGGVDLTFDPAASLGAGWYIIVRNDAATNITLNPDGGELINGAATLILEPAQAVNVYCDGTAFYTQGQTTAIDGANVALSNLTATSINESLISDTDITDDLGSPSLRWAAIYAQDLRTGPTGGDTLELSAYDTFGTAYIPFVTFTAGNPPTAHLEDGVTAVTQAPLTGDTTLATTKYVDDAVTAGTVTFPITLAQGGTNANLTASIGGIFYSTATAGAILAGTATALQMLQSGSSAAPAWSTATWPATTTANQILYSSANNTVTGLATANDSLLVTSAAGVPSLSTTIPDGVQATTQSPGNNSNLIATTSYVDTAVTAGDGALIYIATATAANSATVNFDNNLSATYDNYIVEIENLVAVSTGVDLLAQVGTGPTPTYSATTYSGSNIASSTGSGLVTGNSATTAFTMTGTHATNYVRISGTATSAAAGHLKLYNTQNAANYKGFGSFLCGRMYNQISGDAGGAGVTAGGAWSTATALTSLRFSASSGNLSTGTFRLYGIKNS